MRSLLASGIAGLWLLCGANSALGQNVTPKGPYAASCQNVHMKGSTLQASCQDSDGRFVPTKLEHADQCADGVINLNGILSCQSGTIPPGSYLSSCTDPRVQGTTLYATCTSNKGKDLQAELHDANRCTGDVANQNGSLRCVASGANKASAPEDKKEGKKKHRLWPLKRGDKAEKSS